MDHQAFFNNLKHLAESQLDAQAQFFKQQLAIKDEIIAQLQEEIFFKDETIVQLEQQSSKLQDQFTKNDRSIHYYRKQLKQSARGNDNLRTELQTYILALGKAKDEILSTKRELVALKERLKHKEQLLTENRPKKSQNCIGSLKNTRFHGIISNNDFDSSIITEDSCFDQLSSHISVDSKLFKRNFKGFRFRSTFATIYEEPEEDDSLKESYQAIFTKVIFAIININCHATSTPMNRASSNLLLSPKQTTKKKRHFLSFFAFAVY